MKKKSFKKYFAQTKRLLFAGVGIIIAGIILFLLNRYVLHTWQIYQGAILTIVAGVVTIICHFSMRIRDGAVDEYAAEFHKELEKALGQYVEESEKHKRYNRVFTYTSGEYELWNNPEKIVFGDDNKARCVKYSGGAFTYTADMLYVVTGNIDLITEKTETKCFGFAMESVANIAITDKSYVHKIKDKEKYVETVTAEITAAGEKIVFTVHPDAMTDEATQKLNRMIESKKGR